jgi:hypothetical protein
MKTLSIVIALILSLSVATNVVAAEGKKDFYKGWIELNSNSSCRC